jgi:hypothetical protein
MNAADDSGGESGSERERLFVEIAALRQQRNGLMAELAACRRENAALRAQIEGKS